MPLLANCVAVLFDTPFLRVLDATILPSNPKLRGRPGTVRLLLSRIRERLVSGHDPGATTCKGPVVGARSGHCVDGIWTARVNAE